MQARMSDPATILPDATEAILTLLKATRKGGVSSATLELVHLRASQINGSSFCVDSGAQRQAERRNRRKRYSDLSVQSWYSKPKLLVDFLGT